jgi:nucleoside-diphosphate-sugar epimerase
MTPVLVAGGAGFLGSPLLDRGVKLTVDWFPDQLRSNRRAASHG